MGSIHMGKCKMWALQEGGLYTQVVFKAGLTVMEILVSNIT